MKEVGSCAYYNNYLALTRLNPWEKKKEKKAEYISGEVCLWCGRELGVGNKEVYWGLFAIFYLFIFFLIGVTLVWMKAIVLRFIDTAWLYVSKWSGWWCCCCCCSLNCNELWDNVWGHETITQWAEDYTRGKTSILQNLHAADNFKEGCANTSGN